MRPVLRSILATGAALLLAASAHAAEGPEAVRDALKKLSPQPPDALAAAPMAGWYEAVFGTQVFYVSEDGRYVLAGNVIDLDTLDNLTEQRKNGIRKEAVESIGEESMVVFAPDEPQHMVTVFTDTRCGYCRKLHQEVPVLNEQGVKVRYLAYPAISPQSRPELVSVWCADDQQAAMDKAKAGESVPRRNCENPVDDQFRLGRELGVRGTPAILLENGELLPGYMPAQELVKRVEAAQG
jgi:thiol:disulfide interchange protein DsbC